MGTTIEYFKNVLGFESYSFFLDKYGYYDFLESLGLRPNRKNISPFTNCESAAIQKNKDLYKRIIIEDGKLRDKYITYLFEEFQKDEDKSRIFEKDMITKNAAGKEIPDEMFVYNRKENNFIIIKKSDIPLEYYPISRVDGEFSLCFGRFRTNIGWQNGTGLYNPTIRVFLN